MKVERESGTEMVKRVVRKSIGCIVVASALVLIGVAGTPSAMASLEVTQFGADLIKPAGAPLLQGGAHPDVVTSVHFGTETAESEFGTQFERPKEAVRTVRVDLPPGLLGAPAGFGECNEAELVAGGESLTALCSIESQVGTISLTGLIPLVEFPLYNMEAPAGAPALFAANVLGTTVRIVPTVRAGGGYHIGADVKEASQGINLRASTVRFWGVPADSSHDSERFRPNLQYPPTPSTAPRVPLMSNPTACSGSPLQLSVEADSWEVPGVFAHASTDHDSSDTPLTMDGCERLPFEPTVSVQPTSSIAGAPSGLVVHLEVPQSRGPEGLASSHLKDIEMSLPKGMSIASSAAGGLGGCSQMQIGLGSDVPSTCPDSSKIGTVSLDTPLLADPLSGDVYLASPNENEFGSLIALYIVVRVPGAEIKIPGSVSLDSSTGQANVSFENNPQFPFNSLTLQLNSGSRAPLTLPEGCGTYTTTAELTPWARPNDPVTRSSSFTINQGCGKESQFAPGFEAGTTKPVGGSSSPFGLRVTRGDAEQNVSRIETTLPKGVLAKLAGVPLCGDADAATGNCPSGSQVGSTTVGVGAGSNPLYVPQPGKAPTAVYLAGPYRGAPYSLVVKVPAQAGPFDLGTVAVRNAIEIDPETAQVSVKSDPLPQILQGIPIAYRDIRVNVDRPDFTLNPTSCDPMEVKGTIGSAGGKSAAVSDRFQVANCERLAFKPTLKLKLSGAPTRRGGYPKLRAELRMPKGGANISRAQVLLPKTELLENSHIRTICTRVQYAAQGGGGKACPPASVYGYARAWTPLLDKPLEGPVYLRSSSHKLPDLVASLDGQIHVDLVGRIDAKKARIRNTFESVPDAPVSKFVLTMQGGRKGLLANNTDICKTKPRANATFVGQNGKVAASKPLVKVAKCGKKGR